MMPPSPALRVCKATKHYTHPKQPTTTVGPIDLEVGPGESYGLIGVNGAGKTTLIKAILHLHRLDDGEIFIHGHPHHQPESRQHLCYLPEKFTPSPLLTGREIVELTLMAYGMKADPAPLQAKARMLGLDGAVLDRPLRHYSKGMGQKIGLLSALLSQRKLLLLDEPMSGLDPSARMLLRKAIREYLEQDTDRSVFFSSHLLTDIEALCTRVAVMHAGQLVFVGEPSAFVQRYKAKNLDMAFEKMLESYAPESVA
jgi:ABC-2 type transport system ATP-binding protein